MGILSFCILMSYINRMRDKLRWTVTWRKYSKGCDVLPHVIVSWSTNVVQELYKFSDNNSVHYKSNTEKIHIRKHSERHYKCMQCIPIASTCTSLHKLATALHFSWLFTLVLTRAVQPRHCLVFDRDQARIATFVV